MTEQSVDEEKFEDLAEVYGVLKRDVKDMLLDLLEGVSLWKSASRMSFGFALVAFALVPLFVWGSLTTREVGFTLSTGLGLIAGFMLGVGALTSLTGVRYRTKYSGLRKKYSELYESAKKLS
ncbi:MAG: hypothetical protein OK438_05075 [Thaumarchaeota archaeon]|nr:hypothetical protein [Nitrososphaerota archaeon]